MEINVMPDWVNFGLQLLNTTILFFIVRHFTWAPVKVFLKKRQDSLNQEVRETQSLKEEAKNLQGQAASRILEARAEGEQIIENSKQRAQEVYHELVEAAKNEAGQTLDQAKAEIELEKKQAYASIGRDMVKLAIESAGRLLESEITPQAQHKLFEDLLIKVEGSHE